VACRPCFNDLTLRDDNDVLSDAADNGEIVRDEKHRQPAIRLQLPEPFNDLRLNRDIQGRGDFVAHEKVRIDYQRSRDRGTLPFTAGELIWEALVV
jgi:hypothetical protein